MKLQLCERDGSVRGRRSGMSVRVVLAALVATGALSTDPTEAQESLGDPVRAARTPSATDAESDAAPPSPETPPQADSAPDGAASDVQLDQLLRLPNTLDFREERKGGAGASDWRRRFREAEQRVEDARAKLARVESELETAAVSGGSQWQIAPPGQTASSDTGPLSFRLREELRRTRDDLEEAERQQRALVVEADLAEVPESWRQSVP